VLVFLTCDSSFNGDSGILNLPPDRIVSALRLFKSSFLVHLRPLELFCFALGSWYNSDFDKPIPNSTPSDIEMFSDSVFALSVLVHGFNFIDFHIDRLLFSDTWNNKTLFGKFSPSSAIVDSDYFTSILKSETIIYKIDKIVDKSLINFSNHVYNLETVSGDYITGNTIVSNCRCTFSLVIPED